jgi:hypothetical protein
VKQLCQFAAARTLREAKRFLRQQGITDPLIFQTYGGSAFTSEHFQATRAELGSWGIAALNKLLLWLSWSISTKLSNTISILDTSVMTLNNFSR